MSNVMPPRHVLYAIWRSPLSDLELEGDERGLTALRMPGARSPRTRPQGRVHDVAAFATVIEQLEEYFSGRRTAFNLRLFPGGTRFDQAVWDRVRAIPYGETITYAALAREIGLEDVDLPNWEWVRAVAAANGRNPLPVIVPCHRVVGSDGSLTGYVGGLDRKRALLDLEQGVWQQSLL